MRLRRRATVFDHAHPPGNRGVRGRSVRRAKGFPRGGRQDGLGGHARERLGGERGGRLPGARIPGYSRHRQSPVEEYVYGRTETWQAPRPSVVLYLKHGFEIVEIIPGYMEDSQSLDYGVLIEWAIRFTG